jgi:nucleotide-binding universal stress UspA family protein
MAKRILVPLDHTSVAESVVPIIADAARSAGATVRLLHVAPLVDNVETPEGRVIAYADQEMDRLEAEVLERLRALAEAHLAGVPDPAEEILEEIDAFGADLVAVGTRTRSSLSRALLGSVAEDVVRKSPATVMLVRPARASG